MTRNGVPFSDVHVGDQFSFSHFFSLAHGKMFAGLVGDSNAIHIDAAIAHAHGFSHEIVHGMLAGSLFSRIVGMYCPGEYGFYLSQSLQFHRPIAYDTVVTVQATVIERFQSIAVATLRTELIQDTQVMISGHAKVKFYDETNNYTVGR